eukprot:TRINITY_DN1562_c1_g1_i1.p1 TRINITY_DN1562_c1_g1~~TRINITY_DN1562_c1_g1_i1.p1  ORF type:complete len:182 (+),score=21.98 TRINITY_DN1562_c1_g1_i1:56-547(+)
MQPKGPFGGVLDSVLSESMMHSVDEDLEMSKLFETSGPTGTMLPDGTLGASSISCSSAPSIRSNSDNIVAMLELKLSNAEAEAASLRQRCSMLKADVGGPLPPLPPPPVHVSKQVKPPSEPLPTRSSKIPPNIVHIQDVPFEFYERIRRSQVIHPLTNTLMMP